MTKHIVARLDSAEDNVTRLADAARAEISRIGSRCSLLEAAIKVLMRHDLLFEFALEHGKKPEAENSQLDHVGPTGDGR